MALPTKLGLAAGFAVLVPSVAQAGMTSFSLDELAGARIEVISFFLAVFVVCAFVVRWAWNTLAEVIALPLIRFKHAFCLMLISGLLLYVVLTMISGARELMTPGAWDRAGIGYKLATPKLLPQPWLDTARREALRRLHGELMEYAESHGGAFPANRETSGIEPQVWAGTHPGGDPFSYVGWLGTASPPSRILAYETADYGTNRQVLLVDGTVEEMGASELLQRLRRELDAVVEEALTVEGE